MAVVRYLFYLFILRFLFSDYFYVIHVCYIIEWHITDVEFGFFSMIRDRFLITIINNRVEKLPSFINLFILGHRPIHNFFIVKNMQRCFCSVIYIIISVNKLFIGNPWKFDIIKSLFIDRKHFLYQPKFRLFSIDAITSSIMNGSLAQKPAFVYLLVLFSWFLLYQIIFLFYF